MRLPKIHSNILAIVFLTIFLLPLASCHKQKVYKIGVSQCSRDDWRAKMNEEIEHEILMHPEAQVEILSAEDSSQKQIEDIKYFVDNKFDIIIVAPNEADALTPIITEVYERGIPVVVFDRDVNGKNYTAYQGADNYAIGKSVGEYANNLLKGNGKIIELCGLQGSTPAIGRHKGFVDNIAHNPRLNVLASGYGNWNYDKAYSLGFSMLREHKDVDLIYAHNDRMAIAASDVSRKLGIHPYIIGVDAAPEIGVKAVMDSVIDATFLYPTEGHRLIRTALSILKNEPYDTLVTLPIASPVNASNADILLIQNESLKEETKKMKALKTEMDAYWERHSTQSVILYICLGLALIFCGATFFILRAYWQRIRYQDALKRKNALLAEQHEKQKVLNEQLNVATQSKLMFFTNVSHDLRTPLTLIAEPVSQLAKAGNIPTEQKKLIQLADKNVRILRRLINEILDFRKYENGKLSMNLTETNFKALAIEWVESFRSIAKKKDIDLKIEIPSDQDFQLALDIEKMERVCYNLLSNALKYTPANGTVVFSCSCDGKTLRFSVADTGIGISESDCSQIFDRFFQVDKVRPKGSGIGLSLVKAFVELHGGEIKLESKQGKGSEFTVTIPVTHCEESVAETSAKDLVSAIEREDIEAELENVDDSVIEFADNRPLVLVIDDNNDVLLLLRSVLGKDYNVITASGAKDGLHLAARYTPDVIVCDVMMPGIDGMECCRRLKGEMSTSHIPVLMLTACSAEEQRATAYDSGADGYLSKPFDVSVLKSRIASLISNRKIVRALWGDKGRSHNDGDLNKPLAVEPLKPKEGKDVENEFYSRFVSLVEKEMGNPDLNVDQLASEMGLGRSQFYRKIKALTNYSPVELLRNMRLKRARHLLTTTTKSISEIGYEVGFSTPAYFSKCYREAYGETPSELRSKLGM